MEINEERLKVILDEQRAEFQHFVKSSQTEQRNEFQHVVGIFKEHLESQIQTIGEQLGTITEDMQIVKSDIDIMKSDIVIVKSDIDTIKSDIDIMKSDIDIIKVDLRRKVDYDEFNALAKRVASIESKMRK
jgi:peptidoglycan hydrolase CwlO-like protein